MHEAVGGDHSFKLTGRDPARQAAMYDDIQRAIAVGLVVVNRRRNCAARNRKGQRRRFYGARRAQAVSQH